MILYNTPAKNLTPATPLSFQIVRLDELAPRAGAALPLVKGTIQVQLALAAACQLAVMLTGDASLSAYLEHAHSLSFADLLAAGVSIAWIGACTSGAATWAQVVGQARVGASRAAIFYATQPVWAAGLAVASGMDSLTSSEVVGGLLIVSGSMLLAITDGATGGDP